MDLSELSTSLRRHGFTERTGIGIRGGLTREVGTVTVGTIEQDVKFAPSHRGVNERAHTRSVMNDSGAEDHAVIRRIQAGDRNAYAELVRKYQTKVRGYCVNTLRDATLAEDAAQEIFLKAYQGLTRFRGDAAFSSWLYRITINHCRDVLRKTARRRTESLDALLEESGDRIEALLAAPDDPQRTSEHTDLIRQILAGLPDAHREILLLREAQGLSYEELADTLSCSLDAVKGRLKRARQELTSQLRHFSMPGDVITGRGA